MVYAGKDTMKILLRLCWKIFKFFFFMIGVFAVALACVLLLVAMLQAAGKTRIADKSVLVFDLNTRITDRPVDESSRVLARLLHQESASLQLRAATQALHEAARDDRISALYLHGSLVAEGYSSGYGALRELREAIQDFRKSGKPVIAYLVDADNRDFYLASAADQILLNPFGLIAFRGLAIQGTFFKGAADKYGVEFTAIRRGKYKSAVEPFTRENFSPENREQIEALVRTMWGEILRSAAQARKLSPDRLQALVNRDGLIMPQAAKASGLVTELAYEGDALDKLRQLTGTTDREEQIPQVSIADYAPEAARAVAKIQHGKDKIAILYAEGTIIQGEGSPGSDGQIAGDRFARLIRKLEARKDIKAVVLRVNSPGGSAEASEVILDELRRCDSNRPVIVSMGTVAASGGYFISMASRRIIAEPDTITGSIGVFGLMLNLKTLANDHGVTFDTVKTGALADLGTIARPMTPEEHAVVQNVVDYIYDQFVLRVAQCRRLTTNQVDNIAQGRVWSGADALKVGLVDELGGLQRAIEVAASEAKLGTNYSVVEFPEKKGLAERLAEALRGGSPPVARTDLAAQVAQKAMREWQWLSNFNDPQGVYALLPIDLEFN
jgi:protease-4